MTKNANFLLNDVDIGSSLKFKNSFWIYDTAFLKILKDTFFRDTLYGWWDEFVSHLKLVSVCGQETHNSYFVLEKKCHYMRSKIII